MKRSYGSWLLRALRGGAVLTAGEQALLATLVAELPAHLRNVVEAQFDEYNLVQREVDGRALNFYKVSFFSFAPQPVSQVLESKRNEAPLVRLAVQTGEPEPLHATLTAVNGRVFCASFSKRVPRSLGHEFKVSKVVHAWKSNFAASSAA